MCKEYINIQTGEVLDLEKVESLVDNALLKIRPELWVEWNFEKNNELGFDIWKFARGSDKKVWWLGECGHEWDAQIRSRSNGHGCTYCARRKTIKGFNDMWTTNPKLANLLANPEDGYEYMESSMKRVDWKCPDCGKVNKNKRIANVSIGGLSCSSCSDGMSYPEKFMYNLLKELNVEFIKELSRKDFKWIDGKKRYDFYIPSLNIIIETHGSQHYTGSFANINGKTLEEEQENDRTKRELALNNGIEHYIELDCRESNMEYIRNSILSSDIFELLNVSNVDWEKVAFRSEKSLIFDICDNWNNGMTVVEIIKKNMLSIATVLKYLKRGNQIGICNYNKRESIVRGMEKIPQSKSRTFRMVVQLTLNDEYIKTHNSISEASIEVANKNTGNVRQACIGKLKSAYGYKWMYKEEYDKCVFI